MKISLLKFKRIFSFVAIPFMMLAGSVMAQSNNASGKKRPNILFLFADDQRAKTIRALGNNEILTPNLDRLVKEGTSFPHAYIMGSKSGAVCVSSRAMLMTGKNVAHLEANGNIPADHNMMGTTLAALGYQSYGIGKWHNGTDSYTRNFTDGDEIMFGGMTMNQYEIPLIHFHKDGKYDTYCKPGNKQICDHITPGKHSAEIFADAASSFLTSEKSKDPFFMYVAFTSPHDPRQMPDSYKAMYDISKISLPPNFLPKHPFDNGEMNIRDELLLGYPRKPDEVKKEILDYFATITYLDSQIGRILDALKKSGQYDNTIIIFAGDNGLAIGQHGLLGKQSVYEHSVGVPMIWAGPGIAKNQRSEAYAYLTDIFPTLCDVLKTPAPASVDGKSFIKCLTNAKATHRGTMYYAYKDVQRAVSDHRYKLIEYHVKKERHTQLFDLQADPFETTDLISNEKFAAIADRLKKEMQRCRTEFDDQGTFWNGF